MTPTKRTLQRCRKLGWIPDVTERWLPRTRRRKDLFGFIDVLAINLQGTASDLIGIQCTAGSCVSARVKKITTDPDVKGKAIAWLEAGGRIEVWGWRKLKVKRGGKAVRWEPVIRCIDYFDF